MLNTPIMDLATVLFWALTYILICISGYRSRTIKKVAMPYIAGVLNFAWEICALIWTRGRWMYVLWFIIDIIIVLINFSYIRTQKGKILYLFAIVATTGILYYLFQLKNGFIYTVYVIDLVMAVCYLIQRCELSKYFKRILAITRFIGDFFAGFVFGKDNWVVMTISIIVCLANALYIWLCFYEKKILAD